MPLEQPMIAFPFGFPIIEPKEWTTKQLLHLFQDQIPVKGDFSNDLKSLCTAYRNKLDLRDESSLRPFYSFQVNGRTWRIFSVGSFAAIGTFVAYPKGATYHLEVLSGRPSRGLPGQRYYPMDEDGYPMSGFFDHGSIVVSGRLNHYSNYGSAFAARYIKSGSQWKLAQFQQSVFEGGTAKFKRVGNTWKMSVSGRAYPKCISVPHSDASVIKERIFTARNGILLPSHDRFVPCEMKTMDDLIAASRRRDLVTIRNIAKTPVLAQKFIRLTKGVSNDWWDPVDHSDDCIVCTIPKTDILVTVKKVGKGYKLTKIQREESQP